MRLTVLCDNSVGPISGTLGEHGFAAFIETADAAYLFDTGSGGTLLHNAQRLKRDLARVEKVFLSHGHYDHTGGLWSLLSSCGPKEVHAHPDLFGRRYRVKDTGESISIGIPYGEEFLRGCGAKFHYSDTFREVAPGIYLTGSVPRVTDFEHGDAGLFCDDTGCVPDLVPDDQSLVIRTSHGLVMLLGCCHAGLINTLRHAVEQTGVSKMYAIIGGTHLGFCANDQLEATVRALREYRVEKIFPSHCSGFAAAARLMGEFPGKVHPAQVGFTIELQE